MVTVFVPRAAIALALTAALTLALAGLGHRWSWWGVAASFSVLRVASFAAVAVGAIALLGIVLTVVGRAWPGLALAVAALLIAGFVVWLPLSLQNVARSVPPIHDITTDTERPPAFVAIVERRREAPNPPEYGGPAVAAQQKQGYPDIGPVTVAAPPDRVLAAAEAAGRGLGWEIVAVAPAEGRLEATATTPWFGFKDDVVVRVTAAGGGSRVDVRSKSRVGRSDLGVNARRVRDFLAALAARLA
jgi:uncharacterized protein (DUF1499 family)